MGSMVHSVRFKLLAAFGLCLVLLLATGVFGVTGLIRLNSNMADAYTGNTLPIAQLAEMRSAQLNVRLQLRRTQVFKDDAAKIAYSIQAIRTDMERINGIWKQYFPDSITSDEERQIANQINDAMPAFNATTNDAINELQSGHADVASEHINQHTNAGDAMSKLLAQDIAINVAQAKTFVVDSEATYHRILGVAIALV